MKTLKYRGHPIIGPIYRTTAYAVEIGGTIDVSDGEAERVMAMMPDSWEVLDEAKRDKPEPENHRMRKAPAKRRGKT